MCDWVKTTSVLNPQTVPDSDIYYPSKRTEKTPNLLYTSQQEKKSKKYPTNKPPKIIPKTEVVKQLEIPVIRFAQCYLYNELQLGVLFQLMSIT